VKVLLPASEVAPIIKFGGLGDVIGSLPKALAPLGVDVDVAIPYYPTVSLSGAHVHTGIELNVPFGESNHVVRIFKTKLPDTLVDVLLFQNDEFFSKGGTSAFARTRSETEMFAFFDRCVVEFIKAKYNIYDLIHCNDWHTGLITHLLADELGEERPATLFTIHNLMYQGVGDLELVQDTGFVPGTHPLIDWDTADGDINMLQQGITSSDYVNTVSEKYAEEILTPEFGGEMYEILQARSGRLSGILNGINYDDFPRKVSPSSWQQEKLSAKESLRSELGLSSAPNAPLFASIGRLDAYQKGLEVLFEALPTLIEKGGQFVLLGTGDPVWETKLLDLQKDPHVKKALSVNIVFDVDLAAKIYEGADFLVVPSRYEPCGLIQMIAMHYGTVPVVHAVGGLDDTVEDGHNGIKYAEHSVTALANALDRASKLYSGQGFSKMVSAAFAADFSWDTSAKKYADLYQHVIELRE
jgi:starch synthase